MKKYSVFYCFLIFLLSGCMSNDPKHSKIISFTPASVIVDYSATNDLIEATDQAQRYCSSMGKDAQYVRTDEKSSYIGSGSRIAFFNCKKSKDGSGSSNTNQQIVIPFNNNNNNNNNSSNNNRQKE